MPGVTAGSKRMLITTMLTLVVSIAGLVGVLRTVDSSSPLHIKIVVNPILRVELSIGDDSK